MDLTNLGWCPQFCSQFDTFRAEGFLPARIGCEYQHIYTIFSDAGILSARVSGRFRHRADDRSDFPVVGDWVAVELASLRDQATIHATLPRRTSVCRKVAGNVTDRQVIVANIDVLFIVCALDFDFNIRRIERYLAVARESGAEPVVVLNKADLVADPAAFVQKVSQTAPEAPVLVMSALEGAGIDQLGHYLSRGKTGALLGSSGVGKSTILNSMMGLELQETNSVRSSDGRGRHTTTSRALVPLQNGGAIIDNPGMREVQVWCEDESIDAVFDDIEALSEDCRFSDCSHTVEPGCAILAAVGAGAIDGERLGNYRKLQREAAFLARRQDQRARLDEKRRVKQITKRFERRARSANRGGA